MGIEYVRFRCPSSPPRSRSCSKPRETVERPEDPPEITRDKTPEWRIEVLEDLAITHPLVKRAAAAIRKSSREVRKNRVVRWQDRYQAKPVKPGAGHVDIAVSKASLPRASRIMQALLAAFDRRGCAVRVNEKNETSVNLVRRALEAKRERALHTERQERWVVQDEKNRLAQQQRDSEALRRRRLRTAAVRWARHQRTVAFVNAVERRLRDGSVGSEERANAERWLSWASEQLKE